MNRFERLMFRRIPFWILALFALATIGGASAYGWLVKYKLAKGPRFETIGQLALDLASVPDTLNAMRHQGDLGVSPVSAPLQSDGLSKKATSQYADKVLVARYDPPARRFIVALTDMRSGQVLRRFAPDIAEINRRSQIKSPLLNIAKDRFPARYRLSHPLLMPDGGIVFQDAGPLVRINACGQILWTLDGIYHHAIERDADGAIWVAQTPLKSEQRNVSVDFREDSIAKISPDGKLLFRESLADIFRRNGLGYLFEGRPYTADPFHLNDIQPVLTDGPHMLKGDLFLSLRHLSMVLQYRPSSGKIVWWQMGPWRMQHDVNILDAGRIAIYDNRVVSGTPETVDQANDVVVFDLATRQITYPFTDAFKAQKVQTVTQGRGTPLPNGDVFIEETEYGRLLRLSPDGEVRWEYIAANSKKERLLLAWSRVLSETDDAADINAARQARCK